MSTGASEAPRAIPRSGHHHTAPFDEAWVGIPAELGQEFLPDLARIPEHLGKDSGPPGQRSRDWRPRFGLGAQRGRNFQLDTRKRIQEDVGMKRLFPFVGIMLGVAAALVSHRVEYFPGVP